MTYQENIDLTRRMFEDIWNAKQRSSIDEYYSADMKSHGFGAEEGDIETYKQWYDLITTAFPDIEFEVGEVFADEHMTAATWRATGTHDGELMGLEPTGNRGTVSGISINRVEDGEMVETWMNFDSLKMMEIVGAAKGMAPAGQ